MSKNIKSFAMKNGLNIVYEKSIKGGLVTIDEVTPSICWISSKVVDIVNTLGKEDIREIRFRSVSSGDNNHYSVTILTNDHNNPTLTLVFGSGAVSKGEAEGFYNGALILFDLR